MSGWRALLERREARRREDEADAIQLVEAYVRLCAEAEELALAIAEQPGVPRDVGLAARRFAANAAEVAGPLLSHETVLRARAGAPA